MLLPECANFENLEHLRSSVGHEICLTDYRPLTQDQVNRFADLSLDRQWIHVDTERTRRESPFKGPISHGLLNLTMAAHFLMSGVKVHVVNYGLVTDIRSARFISAIPVESQIRGRVRLLSAERVRDAIKAVWLVTVERQGGMLPCCVVEFVVQYYGQ